MIRSALAAAFALALAAACDSSGAQVSAGPPPATPVQTALAVARDVPIELVAVGHVEPLADVTLKAQIGGQLKDAHFREGDEVKAGDLLVTIDPRPYQIALEKARADVDALKASAADAEAMAKQMDEALTQRAASQRSVDEARAHASALRASEAAAEAEVRSAELSLEYCTLKSPIDGRTGTLLVKPGNIVKANETELVSIQQMDPIQVGFAVPEQELGAVLAAHRKGAVRVRAAIPNATGGELVGELAFIDNQVDHSTGTIRLRGKFANADRRLWPGQFVQVTLELGLLPNAIVVPATAVQSSQSGSIVYVVKADHTVELRPVEVARTLEHDVVVGRGISVGDPVVTAGQLRLVPGAKVSERADEPAKTSGAH